MAHSVGNTCAIAIRNRPRPSEIEATTAGRANDASAASASTAALAATSFFLYESFMSSSHEDGIYRNIMSAITEARELTVRSQSSAPRLSTSARILLW